jgi:mannose-1-phosphate guanylyltransferase/mannose-1-phosphate guanylyltransferase/mannose-6-phosphate isomerase
MIAVVLAGGAGTRLWPVSRELYPKPFMKLPDGQSLLQKAFLRAVKAGAREVLTVTGQEHHYSALSEYQALGLPEVQTYYIIEPLRRNTAPAIAMAALWIAERNPDELMLVLSADQLISHEEAFAQAVAQAKHPAQQGYLVTFGIQPSYPATGFGYIERGEALEGSVYQVSRFVEKPDQPTAEAYLNSGRYRKGDGVEGAIVPRIFNAGVHGPLPPTPQGLYDGNRNGPAVLAHPGPGITWTGGDAHRAYHPQKELSYTACTPPRPRKARWCVSWT